MSLYSNMTHYSPKEKRIVIEGIECLIHPDEHEFWHVYIDHPGGGAPFGQPQITSTYLEYLVRGEVDEDSALTLAGQCIRAKKDGCVILHHDPEGRIMCFKMPPV